MLNHEWVQWLKRSFRRLQKAKQPKLRPRYRPLLESLEDRTVMSITVLSTAAVSAGPPVATATGQSEAVPTSSVSANGQYVVFASTANNLVPGQSTPAGELNVFLHDNVTGTTTLVSHQYGHPTWGGTSNYLSAPNSFNPAISGDGSTIAFYSEAGDLDMEVNPLSFNTTYVALYVYNVPTGQMTLASHAYGDHTTVGNTFSPEIPSSGSAHYVNTLAYSASNDTKGLALPSLSYNGEYVAYISDADDIVRSEASGGSGGSLGQGTGAFSTNAYLYDNNPLDANYGTNAMVSHSYNNDQQSGETWVTGEGGIGAFASTVAISADGSTVAFTDPGTLLTANTVGNGNSDQLYVWSRINNANTGLTADETVLASHAYSSLATGGSNASGWTANNPPSLSADGTEVAYYSDANNLVSGQLGTTSTLNVFRYNVFYNTNDLVTHVYGILTTAGNNPTDRMAEATGPQISATGEFIAYANDSNNLLSANLPVSNGGRDNVYLYDAVTQQNTLVSNNGDGTGLIPDVGGGTAPSMSADGMYVTFADRAIPTSGSLTTAAGNVNVHLYTRGSTTPPTVIGLSWDGTLLPPLTGSGSNAAANLSLYASGLQPTVISADGSTIVWSGPATTNVTVPSVTDTNLTFDVFEGSNPSLSVGQVPVITSSNTLTLTTGTTMTPFTITATNTPTSFTLTGTTMPSGLTFNTTTGVLTGTPTVPGTYTLTATATNTTGTSTPQTLTVTINPGLPTAIGLTNESVTAAQPIGTTIGTLTTTDPNANQTFTYTLITTGTPFTIVGNTLETNTIIQTTTVEQFNIQITTTDLLNQSLMQPFTITVNPSTQSPTNITLTGGNVSTDQPVGTLVGTLTTTDPNAGQTITYGLTGTNSGLFTVDSNGNVSTTSVFTNPGTYTVTVTATDSPAGQSITEPITITVVPTTQTPTGITLSNDTVTAAQPIGTTVGTLTTTDPNVNQTFTYAVTPGSPFTIVGNTLETNSIIQTTTVEQFTIQITTTDSANLSHTQTFTITVNPTTQSPTNITLTGGTVAIDQPVGTLVGTLTTTDPNAGQTITYGLTGTNSGLFTVDSNGNVSTTSVFTTPGTYTIIVTATDSPAGLSYSQPITITVNPSTTPPTAIALSNNSVTAAQPIGTTIGTLSTTDPNVNQTFTYTLITTGTPFTITGNTLKTNTIIQTTTVEQFTIQIQTTDSLNLSHTQTFTITVNPSTASPTNITLTGGTVTTNQPIGTIVGTLTTTDPNAGQTITYGLTGANAGLFTVDSNGNVSTTSVFTTPGTYTIIVTATDSPAGLSYSQPITITVNASTVAPTVTGLSTSSGPEAGGTVVVITGTGFTGATAVNFGSATAVNFTINSDTQITATDPSGSGVVDVTVTGAGTSALSSADQFTYVAVTTTSLTDSGPNPSDFGQAVSFTAAVSWAADGETVFIEDASNANAIVASPTLSGGTVTFEISDLTAGTHDLFAVYNGDMTHFASNSSLTPVTQVVNESDTLPTVTSAVVNGGDVGLAGQNSVVKQILVTFNEPVTLDAGALTVVNDATGVTALSGPAPNTLPVNAIVTPVAGSSNTQFMVTFSGTGTTTIPGGGTIIKDGLYVLHSDGSKIHASLKSGNDQNVVFWALYGSAASDNTLSGAPGDGSSEIVVDTPDFSLFKNTFGSESDIPDGPVYNPAMDANEDGVVDTLDFAKFKNNFGADWLV